MVVGVVAVVVVVVLDTPGFLAVCRLVGEREGGKRTEGKAGRDT